VGDPVAVEWAREVRDGHFDVVDFGRGKRALQSRDGSEKPHGQSGGAQDPDRSRQILSQNPAQAPSQEAEQIRGERTRKQEEHDAHPGVPDPDEDIAGQPETGGSREGESGGNGEIEQAEDRPKHLRAGSRKAEDFREAGAHMPVEKEG
jgi:hypothetical protein